jgi:hypothetical protein
VRDAVGTVVVAVVTVVAVVLVLVFFFCILARVAVTSFLKSITG